MNKTQKGCSIDKLLSEGVGYVTCSVLNTVQSVSEQNSLSFTTFEREGYADRTAPLSPLARDTMRRGTECVSDRDTEQSAKCRISKSSLETVKCRPVWDRTCLYFTGDVAGWRLDGRRARLYVGRF